MIAWTDRHYKDQYRKLAVLNNKKKAKVYFTLPSDSIADITTALDAGSIDKNTFVIAVERDPVKANTIRNKLKNLFKKYIVVQSELYVVEIKELLKKHNLPCIDLAFFDMCGQMTDQIANWICNFDRNIFAKNAKVSWTFSTSIRYNLLLNTLNMDYEGFGITPKEWPMRRMVDKAMDRCNDVGYARRTGESEGTFFSLYSLFGALRNNWLFSFDRIHEYRDTRSPMLYVETTISGESKNENGVTKNILDSIDCINPKRQKVQKQKVHRQATPAGMSPQQWAWHPNNPNGIRRAG